MIGINTIKSVHAHDDAVVLVTPVLPPRIDGIGDYTASLAKELGRNYPVHILTSLGQYPAPIERVAVEQAYRRETRKDIFRLIPALVEKRPRCVFIQYNPFCYGRWGINMYIPLLARSIKQRLPDTRLGIMVHEPFVPMVSAKSAIMGACQRAQLLLLGRMADVVLFSIDPWVQRFRSWFPNKPVLHMPVSSNIPRADAISEDIRVDLSSNGKTIVGLFGTMHESRMPDLIDKACRVAKDNGAEIRLLYIGPDGAAVRRSVTSVEVVDRGALPPEEVSRHFGAMDLYLAPYIDGVSTRRTTLMTGLQHGVATLGTEGHLTDAILAVENTKSMLLSKVGDTRQFGVQLLNLVKSRQMRDALGQSAVNLFERQFSWARLVERMSSIIDGDFYPLGI